LAVTRYPIPKKIPLLVLQSFIKAVLLEIVDNHDKIDYESKPVETCKNTKSQQLEVHPK